MSADENDDWTGTAELVPQQDRMQERTKAIEALLRTRPSTLRVVDDRPTPEPEAPPPQARPKTREFLFRGGLYTFEAIGVRSEKEKRSGVVERWQSDIHADQNVGINLVIYEYYDGRFTPWAFDGIFFNDFLQAASVGVVSGGFQAQWHHEQQQHERTRRKMALLLPAAAVLGFMAGVLLFLR